MLYYTADTVSGDIVYAPPTLPPMPPVLSESVLQNDDDDDAVIAAVLQTSRRRRTKIVTLLKRSSGRRQYAVHTGGVRRKLKRLPQLYGPVRTWKEWMAKISETEFHETYRMPKRQFNRLARTLRPYLVKNAGKQKNASGSIIEPELTLACGLRWLAGASVCGERHGN